jgi:uncharacterized protein YmfQ (DUF2313 family)
MTPARTRGEAEKMSLPVTENSLFAAYALVVCPASIGAPPSIADAESAPTGDSLAPQIQLLTPRGAAWSTDENYAPDTVQSGVWLALSGFAARLWSDLFGAFSQAFPSAVSYALTDWETELGLPEPGEAASYGALTVTDRLAAIQTKYRDSGGASSAYFICIARQIGYRTNVHEPGTFEFGVSTFADPSVEDPLSFGPDDGQYWIVQVLGVTPEYFAFGASAFGDALTDFPRATDLEARIRRRANVDTTVIFDYSGGS